MKIQFKDFGISDESVLGFIAKDQDQDQEITFQMPSRFVPAPDLMGLAISTLAGTKYEQISIDLPLTARTRNIIEEVCEANVTSPTAQFPQTAKPGNFTGLNFSGGFDSLAAQVLMPEQAKLISLDFGKDFQREKDFFQEFNTTTVTTNFRSLGFGNNSWSFMGIGTILLRDYLELDTYSFGSILEASPWNMRANKYNNRPHKWFAAAGLKQMNPVQGLTEIGTIMLLSHHSPDLIPKSLKSLAGPGSEKMNRKTILLNIVDQYFDTGIRAELDRTEAHFNFGTYFTTDFLILYIIKRAGLDVAQQLVSNIPSHVIDFVARHRLDFYEKINPNFYENISARDRMNIYTRTLEAGITPYTEADWSDYRAVAKLLALWHPGLK